MLELKGQYNKDCKVFTDNIEEEALKQIYDILQHPSSAGLKIRIMPDVHAGKGICVGFTSEIGDCIAPSRIGVDIHCMMTTCLLDRFIPEDKYALIEHRVRKEIPFGFDINESRQFEMKHFLQFFRTFYVQAKMGWKDMILDVDISEKGLSKWMSRIGIDEGVFYKSIGSVGGGNHFIEFGNTPETSAFTIHCGSRNIGLKVCKYWETVAAKPKKPKAELKEEIEKLKANCKDKRQLPELIRDLTHKHAFEHAHLNGFLFGENMKGYLTDMVIASAYACFNHLVIKGKILDILYKTCQVKSVASIQTAHNYIDFQDRIIRKGSVRSYVGEKFILPFNMRDGIAICEGKSNPDWNCSAPHGAGRIMSRNAAKELLDLEDFKKQMEGIYSTSVCSSTLDEAPDAYKDYQEILANIKDTCDVLYFIKPTINLKAK